MKTLSLLALVVAFGLGTAAMLHTDHHNHLPSPNGSVAQMTDGAFRDGLYLGRLAAERGDEPHVAIGRWATLQDRTSFTTGYQRGYSDFLASRPVPAMHERRAEVGRGARLRSPQVF
jgi:hypothetical protein